MPITNIATLISVLKIADKTIKTILEINDKLQISNNKSSIEDKELILSLCEQALKNRPQTKILTLEEEKAIAEYIKNSNGDPEKALICKLALENNFLALEMILKKQR